MRPRIPQAIGRRRHRARAWASLAAGLLALLSLTLGGCASPPPRSAWVGTWGTAPQLVEQHNMPPPPGLCHSTLRQVVRVSLGGDSLRVRFSNRFSSHPVTMQGVQLALSAGGSTIDTSTITALTFGGRQSVTIAAGSALTSDPVAFRVAPRADVAITIHFAQTSPDVTGHPGSRTTSYLAAGEQLRAPALPGAATADRWYVIHGIEVKAPPQAAAIVAIGNSITDGRGSGTNLQNRWPDILAERLLAHPGTRWRAVLNQGIGGNCVLRECLGPSALDRFARDVLQQPGARWVIILHGVNDLGQAPDSAAAMQVANGLIDAYRHMIAQAQAQRIRVYGATILPFGGSSYHPGPETAFRERARSRVNQWIRAGGELDGVIDFDRALRNPNDTAALLPHLHTGDFLHPNQEGHRAMGEAVPLSLFE